MPEINKEYRAFSGGLITEATPISAPDNAAKDMDNLDLNRDGSMSRRLGMGYESGHSLISTGYNQSQYDILAKSSYLWRSATEDSDIEITVVQIGQDLYFLDATAGALSTTVLNGGVPLVLDSSSVKVPFKYTTISGVLVVATENQYCYYIQYNQNTGAFSVEKFSILVRDIWGIQDDLAIDERPSSLSRKHTYNLKNQGWTESKITSFKQTGDYPSNADVPAVGIDEVNANAFSPFLVKRTEFGTTPAAKGRIIIDLLERSSTRAAGAVKTDTSSDPNNSVNTTATPLTNWGQNPKWGGGVSGVISHLNSAPPIFSGIPTDRTTGGISTVAAFAGRVFFAGFGNTLVVGDTKSPLLGDYVAFSQVVDTPSEIGLCHAVADPTSDSDSELVASDGGTIKVTGAGKVHAMVPLGRTLIVVAERGVWGIAGGSDGVFAADQFEVSKITDVGTSSPQSIVDAEGTIMYWSDSGIYQVSLNPDTLEISASSVSEQTIKGVYDAIPHAAREKAMGIYDSFSKKLVWVYPSTSPYYVYDKELVLDGVIGAWTKSSFPQSSDTPYIIGLTRTSAYSLNTSTDLVIKDGEQVAHNGTNVVHTSVVRDSGATGIRYVVAVPVGSKMSFTFGVKNDATFSDWKDFDLVGADSPAYWQGWDDILDDTQRYKQAKYIVFNFKRTETGVSAAGDGAGVDLVNPSSCKMSAYWDYADSASSNKTTTPVEVYRLHKPYIPEDSADSFAYGHSVVSTRSKLRGRGHALSIKVESSPEKDMIIYSWGVSYTGGAGV